MFTSWLKCILFLESIPHPILYRYLIYWWYHWIGEIKSSREKRSEKGRIMSVNYGHLKGLSMKYMKGNVNIYSKESSYTIIFIFKQCPLHCPSVVWAYFTRAIGYTCRLQYNNTFRENISTKKVKTYIYIFLSLSLALSLPLYIYVCNIEILHFNVIIGASQHYSEKKNYCFGFFL